jgi:hypothetical protein
MQFGRRHSRTSRRTHGSAAIAFAATLAAAADVTTSRAAAFTVAAALVCVRTPALAVGRRSFRQVLRLAPRLTLNWWWVAAFAIETGHDLVQELLFFF